MRVESAQPWLTISVLLHLGQDITRFSGDPELGLLGEDLEKEEVQSSFIWVEDASG